ncbi:unnamed protein product [Prunus armeniaca]
MSFPFFCSFYLFIYYAASLDVGTTIRDKVIPSVRFPVFLVFFSRFGPSVVFVRSIICILGTYKSFFSAHFGIKFCIYDCCRGLLVIVRNLRHPSLRILTTGHKR